MNEETFSKPLDNLSGASVRGDAYDPNSDAWSGAAVRGEAVAKCAVCNGTKCVNGAVFDPPSQCEACFVDGGKDASVEEGEPTELLYQFRGRALPRRGLSEWSGWVPCSKAAYDELALNPNFQVRVFGLISARAADAPSDLRQALIEVRHAIQFSHDSVGGIDKMPVMMHQSGTVVEFIDAVLSGVAADALDSQPTDLKPSDYFGDTIFAGNLPESEAEAIRKELAQRTQEDRLNEIQGASSQPTDGGVRNG